MTVGNFVAHVSQKYSLSTLSSCWIQDYKPNDMSFLVLFRVTLLKCIITIIWNTEKWTLSLQLIQQVIFEKREIANLTVIDSGKLPAESYPISTTHQKAVKMEISSVCRQWCYNLHPGLTWMSRGRGWELKTHMILFFSVIRNYTFPRYILVMWRLRKMKG